MASPNTAEAFQFHESAFLRENAEQEHKRGLRHALTNVLFIWIFNQWKKHKTTLLLSVIKRWNTNNTPPD